MMDRKLERAHRDLSEKVMGRSGVHGNAIGERGGKACLLVYLEDEKSGKDIPRSMGGFQVLREITGTIRPL